METIGYYRLSAYWFPYKTSSGDGKTVFREGTTFDEIMRTYEFDRRLRLLMFEAVARIEVLLRSRLAYFAAKEDGAFGYPDSARTKLSGSTQPRRRASSTSSTSRIRTATSTTFLPTG